MNVIKETTESYLSRTSDRYSTHNSNNYSKRYLPQGSYQAGGFNTNSSVREQNDRLIEIEDIDGLPEPNIAARYLA